MSPHLLIGGLFMSKFKKYNGPDKYHFRFYRKNGQHPFLVVLVKIEELDGKYYLSGYLLTHDIKKWLDYPKHYIRLEANPNPKDIEPAYICTTRIDNIPQKMFSKPYKNWHLSKKDELIIDELEKKKPSD